MSRSSELLAAIEAQHGANPTPQQVASIFPDLASEHEVVLSDYYLDEPGVYEVFGVSAGESVLQSFEAAAEGNAVLTRALRFLQSPRGINVGAAHTQAMIDSLTPSVFSEGQANTLKALGTSQVPKWPGLTLAELQELYRPAWEALYQAEQALINSRGAEILDEAEAVWQETTEYWAAYQADPAARRRAERDALAQANAELIAEGAVRG